MIQIKLGQEQSMRQEQIMAPQQIQSLELLATTLLQLEQKVHNELENNPTLELIDDGLERQAGNPTEDYQAEKQDRFNERDDDDTDRMREQSRLAENLMKSKDWTQPRNPEQYYGGAAEDAESRYNYFWDSLVSEKSLEEILNEQLEEMPELDEKNLRICQEVIGSIDDTGYLRSHPADIAISCQCELAEVENALSIIHSLDPPGVGARDLRECLLLQMVRSGDQNSTAYKIVDKHIEDLGRNRLEQLTKKMKISKNEINKALEEIHKLRPYPASHITPADPTEFVAPEVIVELDEEGNPQVRANRDYLPKLRISSYYLNLLEDSEVSEETKNYVKAKLTKSRQLMKAIEQREATIVRITRILVKKEPDFFTGKSDSLAPLTMTQVAKELDVHETTVSRAVAGKYIMTPRGLFPFRHFFASGYRNSESGEDVSTQTVKQKIRELISNEDRRHPFSDKQIVEQLAAQGFKMARRTVAKYRDELGILSTNLRRRH